MWNIIIVMWSHRSDDLTSFSFPTMSFVTVLHNIFHLPSYSNETCICRYQWYTSVILWLYAVSLQQWCGNKMWSYYCYLHNTCPYIMYSLLNTIGMRTFLAYVITTCHGIIQYNNLHNECKSPIHVWISNNGF